MDQILNDLISNYKHNANLSPCLECCPRCYSKQVTFKQHDCRSRELRYFVNFFVKTFLLNLYRWKCSICKTTFTFYPDFLLPYKRFITPSIQLLCQKYIKMGEASYREIAHPQGSQYTYNNSSQEFSHVSIWNWIKGLSVYEKYAYKAAQLLLRVIPDGYIHRDIIPINPNKYQSDHRRQYLEKTELVIRVVEYLDRHNIKRSIFPTVVN